MPASVSASIPAALAAAALLCAPAASAQPGAGWQWLPEEAAVARAHQNPRVILMLSCGDKDLEGTVAPELTLGFLDHPATVEERRRLFGPTAQLPRSGVPEALLAARRTVSGTAGDGAYRFTVPTDGVGGRLVRSLKPPGMDFVSGFISDEEVATLRAARSIRVDGHGLSFTFPASGSAEALSNLRCVAQPASLDGWNGFRVDDSTHARLGGAAEQCLQRTQTTMDMVGCNARVAKRLEPLVGRAFQEALDRLGSTEAARLRRSQAEWQGSYHDRCRDEAVAEWTTGSMAGVALSGCVVDQKIRRIAWLDRLGR